MGRHLLSEGTLSVLLSADPRLVGRLSPRVSDEQLNEQETGVGGQGGFLVTECPLSFPHRDLRVRAVLLASLTSPGGGGGEWAGGHGLCTCAWPWASPAARPYSYGFSWISAIMVSLEPQGCPSYLKSSCPGLLPGVPDHCLWPGHCWLQCAFLFFILFSIQKPERIQGKPGPSTQNNQ